MPDPHCSHTTLADASPGLGVGEDLAVLKAVALTEKVGALIGEAIDQADDLLLLDGQRREDLDHLVVRTRGLDHEPVFQQLTHDAGDGGAGQSGPRDQLGSDPAPEQQFREAELQERRRKGVRVPAALGTERHTEHMLAAFPPPEVR